jgi:hypothetical protein
MHISNIDILNSCAGGSVAIKSIINSTGKHYDIYTAIIDKNNKWNIKRLIKRNDRQPYTLINEGLFDDPSLIEYITKTCINIGISHCFQQGPLINNIIFNLNIKMIAYFHDVSFLYGSRRLIHENYSIKSIINFSRKIEMEIMAGKNYDAAITVSRLQRRLIQPFFQNKKVYSCPFPVYSPPRQVISNRKKGEFVFIGGADHYSNYQAILSITDYMTLNIIKVKDKFILHIIGNWDNKYKIIQQKLGRFKKCFIFHGFVDQLENILIGRVGLVPVELGSGIKVKILTMLSYGIPVIASKVAAENIQLSADNGLFVYDNYEEMDRLIHYLEDNEAYIMASYSAFNGIKNIYSKKIFNKIFKKIIYGLLQ